MLPNPCVQSPSHVVNSTAAHILVTGEYGGQDPRWEILPQPIWAKDKPIGANRLD